MPMPKKLVVDGCLQCSRCGELKPVAEFQRHAITASGYRSNCRACNGNSTKRGRPQRKIVDGKLQCKICGEWKPLDQIEKHKQCAEGRGSRCHTCAVKRTSEYLSNNLDAFLKNLVARHHQNLTQRTKTRGRKHLWSKTCVTYEFIRQLWDKQGALCAITGRPMSHSRMGGSQMAYNVSIDRIDSDKGYEDGNVQLVCNAVNNMKAKMDMPSLEFWCRAILNGKQ